MTHADAPQEIVDLAEARAVARRGRDWATADQLKDRIEAAGWRVVDAASLYTLERAAPPDVEEGGVVRYGASASVPSRLEESAVGVASVVLVAADWPEDLARTMRSLVDHSPDGTQVVIVANAPSDAQAAVLGDLDAVDPGAPGIVTEVVWTSSRLGFAAALNAGIRRTVAPVVVLLDTSVEAGGDLVSSIVAALDDAAVAVAGPFGLVSDDVRTFVSAPAGAVDVDAVEAYALGFRRADYVSRGPLDEHFRFYANLDIWWSLVLRDQGEGEPEDAPPRRARQTAGIPVTRHEHRGWSSLPGNERDRQAKKNFYRVLKRFATRRDLLVAATAGR